MHITPFLRGREREREMKMGDDEEREFTRKEEEAAPGLNKGPATYRLL